jgi:peroxiredoxin
MLLLPVLALACSSAPPAFGPPFSNEGGADGAYPADSGSTLSCDYPAGPYGAQQGASVDADFQWKCAGPSIASTDLFDCDGTKGINALVFDISAEWCAACTAEAADFKTLEPQYEKLGVKVVTLMIQDASHAPATVATATAWKQKYGLTVDVCADPKFSFQPSGSGSLNLPFTIVVDPRTMRIVHESQGYLSHYPLTPDKSILDLAKRNGATM